MPKPIEKPRTARCQDGEPFTWRARATSFTYAFRGIARLLGREHNAWIHCAFAVGVCVAGACWRIERWEWALAVFAIGSVVTAEAFNTALETLADAVKPDHDPLVGQAKDLAAAAVLLASIAAAIVGVIIFGPRVWVLVAK